MATKLNLEIPQDPFLPQDQNLGPAFLDTQACLCALRGQKSVTSTQVGWQCIGNQTQGVYEVSTGKWFNSNGDKTLRDKLPIWDKSTYPDVSKPLMWDEGSSKLVDVVEDRLSVWDQACTGVNHTAFSTSFYGATAAIQANNTPYDAAPCWRPGAVPMTIQQVDDWNKNGCNEGFLCKPEVQKASG